MILHQTITDFLSQYGTIYVKGNSIGSRCPLCGDSKKSKLKRRFSVTYDNGCAFYNCFNCGRTGTFAELVSELKGIPIGEAIREVETIEFDDIKKTLTKAVSAVKVIPEEQNLTSILDDCISVDSNVSSYFDKQYQKILVSFLDSRKIPLDYKIFIANKGEYKGRYIIPVYHGNEIVYFQGRAMDDTVEPRFKNPLIEKTGIIMNIDYFKRDKFIIVTEGVIDAMMVEDHQGTCVLGGSISDDFLIELYKYTDKGIIIAVDTDERGEKERNKLIESSKYGKLLKYFIPPDEIKDLNEFKKKRNIPNMYDYVTNKCIDYWTLSVHKSI